MSSVMIRDAHFNGGRLLCSRYCQTKWDKIGNCCFSAVRVQTYLIRVKIMFTSGVTCLPHTQRSQESTQ